MDTPSLHDLPDEMWGLIAAALADIHPTWAVLFGTTCKRALAAVRDHFRLRKIHPQLRVSLLTQHVSSLQWALGQPDCPHRDLADLAIQSDSPESINFLWEQSHLGKVFCTWNAGLLCKAATHDRAWVWNWHREHDLEFGPSAPHVFIALAARAGALDFLGALPRDVILTFATLVFHQAASGGCVASLKWLDENFKIDWNCTAVDNAAGGGNSLGVLQWMYGKKPHLFHTNTRYLGRACAAGDFASAKWLYDLLGSTAIDWNALVGICRSGQLDFIQWGYEISPMHFPYQACRVAACETLNFTILEWIEGIWPAGPEDIKLYFGQISVRFRIPVIEWAWRKFGVAPPFQHLMDKAILLRDPGLFDWVRLHSPDCVVNWEGLAAGSVRPNLYFLQWRDRRLPAEFKPHVNLRDVLASAIEYGEVPVIWWVSEQGLSIADNNRALSSIFAWGSLRDVKRACALSIHARNPSVKQLVPLVQRGSCDIVQWLLQNYPLPPSDLEKLQTVADSSSIIGFRHWLTVFREGRA